MAEYSSDLKQQIVHGYLEGTLGYAFLAKKYQIPDKLQIETLVRQYKQSEKNGLKPKKNKNFW